MYQCMYSAVPAFLTLLCVQMELQNPSDLVLFERCIERCNKFGIEMVPLPCPETLYLGAERISRDIS